MENWIQEQDNLKKQLVITDCLAEIKYIGGVDISFTETDTACAGLVIMSYPNLKVIYEDTQIVKMTQPYIPGFLAFREVEFILALIQKLRSERPDIVPQVIFVDGNGVFHSRGFGLASHLGVLCDIPTIGIGKTFFHIDGLDDEYTIKAQFAKECINHGDMLELVPNAYALKTFGSKAVYVSTGHKISGVTAVQLTLSCCKFRLPEPIREADQRTRAVLRNLKKP